MQQRLKKYSRNDETAAAVARKQITDRSLELLATIERYRIIPTSLLLRLMPGNTDITYERLKTLYHQGLINRFCFPRHNNPSEFYYYLDNRRALELLIEQGHNAENLDFEIVKRNREKNYAAIQDPRHIDDLHGRLMFLKHELMISRLRAMLELGCRHSQGQVELLDFRQGPALYNKVEVAKMAYSRELGSWVERDSTEHIPHRPDAFFTLRLASDPENVRHFFYEADRKTASTAKFNRKLRGHFHYIVKQRRHKEHYGIERVRAVLVETLDADWAETLRQGAKHEVVSGHTPTALFWFTASPIFTKEVEDLDGKKPRLVPKFFKEPDVIFKPKWLTAVDDTPRSLIE